VAVDLDVVVDVHAHALPLGIGVAGSRQGAHGRAVELLEEALATPGQLLEGLVIECREQLSDGRVQLRQ
jgi:hypothetical protein